MGSKGGGQPQQVQQTQESHTQTSEPWAPAQAHIMRGLDAARAQVDAGPAQWNGPFIGSLSQYSKEGLDAIAQRGREGSPVTQSAQGLATDVLSQRPSFGGASGYLAGGPSWEQVQQQFASLPEATQNALQQTAQGDYLQGNPYLDQQYGRAAQQVTDTFNRDISPGIAAQFSKAGRVGSDAQGDVLQNAAGQVSDSLAGLSNDIYGGNYQRERDRQLNAAYQLGNLTQAQQSLGSNVFNQLQGNQLAAAGIDAGVYGQQLGQQNVFGGLANALANQDYMDIEQIKRVGEHYDQRSQQELDARRAQFNQEQAMKQQALRDYIAAARGHGVTSSSTTSGTASGPPARRGSPLTGAIGGGLAGYAAGGPVGAVLGGVGGILGGGR